ncbi:MAG: DUF839 domain-containing protein [Bacteroidetes bacterium]|nr:DUF839 domain-containing protein [Bacteroidota bacterium]
MKKIYISFLMLFWALAMTAQNGLLFNPHIDVDWNYDKSIQVPASPIISQVLFVGGYHEVVALDDNGNPVTIMSKEDNDFIGVTPAGNGDYFISVNHESQVLDEIGGDGGGMTAFKVTRDPNTDTLIVTEQTLNDGRNGKFFLVDFKHTVGETRNNCGGIIGPNGDIWTAEEYPPFSNQEIAGYISDLNNFKIGTGSVYEVNGMVPAFEGEVIKRYQNMGYMVKIDPVNAKAEMKQYNWGRMSFEGGVMMPDEQTFYFFEDGTPGMLTKYVGNTPGDYINGKLYIYKHDLNDPVNGNWLEIDNTNLDLMLNMADWAWTNHATMFNRLEWGIEINGLVYIAETGRDDVGNKWADEYADGGVIAPYHYDRATAQGTVAHATDYTDLYGRVLVYDPVTDSVWVYLEGGPEWPNEVSQPVADYPAVHMSNVDGLGKININGVDYLIMNEDLNGKTYNRQPDGVVSNLCEMFLVDVSNPAPVYSDLIRIGVGPFGAELTGGTGTPDSKTIFVNVQHPKTNPNGNIFPYESDKAVTVALTGFDKLTNIRDAEFPIDWVADQDFQAPTHPDIQYQVVFVGGHHKVQILDRTGQPGGSIVSKEDNDFIGFTAATSDEGYGWISINHESNAYDPFGGNGGGMTSFMIDREPVTDSIVVVETTLADGRSGKFFCVDFINTVGETRNNCGGIIGPNGDIWTAEEYPPAGNNEIVGYIPDTTDWIIGQGVGAYMDLPDAPMFNGTTLARYQNMGWMVKIDPENAVALYKQYNWGRMSFEGGVLMPDNKTVFNFEDGTPGLLTKFVGNAPGDFINGKLFVYKHDLNDPVNGNWIEVDNTDMDKMLNFANYTIPMGVTMFNRLEWGVEIGGKVYIAETGLDNLGSKWSDEYALGGIIPQYHYDRAAAQGTQPYVSGYSDYYGRVIVYDPATDQVSVFLEGGPEYANETSQDIADYPAKHLSNMDGMGKISVNNRDYMLLCEDLNGNTYNRVPNGVPSRQCEMYMLDMSITTPVIDDLVRIMVGPFGAEITGAVGTPDGKTILVNLQHPGNNPQGGVFPYSGDHGVTVALTGWDKGNEGIIDNNNQEMGFSVYPNPAFRQLHLNGTYDVAIYDAAGNLVFIRENTNVVNISNLNSGIYFIRNQHGETQKLIIE